ncbi:MAG: sulfatase [Planctomycetota bacterium]
MNGGLFGLADGVVAGLATGQSGAVAGGGCLGLAVLTYGVVWVVVMLAIALPLHPWLRAKPLYGRFQRLLTIAVGLGLFLELYWWTRPYLYSGRAAFDPRRLMVAAGLLLVGLALAFAIARLARMLPRAVKMAGTIAVPLLWVAGAMYLVSLRGASQARGALNPRNRDLPNVLLVVCDALRADMLGSYGNTRVKTPVLDELAGRGVLFENAIVTAPFTWASFGSILTGKYPRRHGLVKIDALQAMRRDNNVTLPWHLKSAVREQDKLPLQEQDFLSGTFMTGTLSHGSGLAKGFDVYYEALVGHDIVDTASPWSIFRSKLVLSILRDKLAQSFDASRVISVARAWLDEHPSRRFVAMVHLYSTHTPYDPPARFREQYCDPNYKGPVHSFYASDRQSIEQGYPLTEADKQQIRNLYEAGVAQADAMIGELLADLEAHGRLDETLVIVTGDHGEELGEHGLWEHNWPFQTNQLVPLIMAWPGHLPAGKRVAAGVQSIDILPTIVDLMRLKLPPEASGPDPLGHIDGASLLPLARDEAKAVRPYAFCENQNFLSVQDTAAEGPRYKLIVAAGDHCATSLSQPDPGAFQPQLYRLDTDHRELENILAQAPREAERLLAVLCAWDASMPIPQYQVLDSDRDTEDRRLLYKQLGYVDGEKTPPPTKNE